MVAARDRLQPPHARPLLAGRRPRQPPTLPRRGAALIGPRHASLGRLTPPQGLRTCPAALARRSLPRPDPFSAVPSNLRRSFSRLALSLRQAPSLAPTGFAPRSSMVAPLEITLQACGFTRKLPGSRPGGALP